MLAYIHVWAHGFCVKTAGRLGQMYTSDLLRGTGCRECSQCWLQQWSCRGAGEQQGWAGSTTTPGSGAAHPFLPKGAFLAPCSHTCEPLFDSLENKYPAKGTLSVPLPHLFVAVHGKITEHRLLIFQIA